MAKRKRDVPQAAEPAERPNSKKPKPKPQKTVPAPTIHKLSSDQPVTIQIVAGSYDRVLHGVTAAVTPSALAQPAKKKKSEHGVSAPKPVTFADAFLFDAHSSSLRCLALSPPSVPAPGQTQKVLLATGSTDERINIYNLSAHPPSNRSAEDQKVLSSITPRPVLENSKNRELGTLLHHSSNITRLAFPNRSKLLSASEDSTIGVARTRDWALLHSFKCPVPKLEGRPSGDTAAAGGGPQGVNDFAVHPSNKIMLSVSKGEHCMRLWNLETGKKARVLNFEKSALVEIGEGRHCTGEARRIVWGSADGEDEFAVGFERDVLVYGMDCRPKCRLMGDTKTKVHEMRYVQTEGEETVVAVSTEDGRVCFFSTAKEMVKAPKTAEKLPVATMVAQLGGSKAGVTGRVKDFIVLPVEDEEGQRSWFIVTAGSDGKIRLWRLKAGDLRSTGETGRQVGELLGTYETQNRITCLGAFIMIPRPDGAEESEFEFESEESDDDSDDE
ncbi:WD40-repeat-containing domain protein [Podospora aff. communis PSN243]|uniref:WD40-repeat-containing domain protein n=1 Tax=Podospora aff. communis PSN243 TaxID=3040156 RepID=A0AAV9GDY6_9PEZI|nr:WD40-repeat-containing domain protein [Podospora aff. communis PSN243]